MAAKAGKSKSSKSSKMVAKQRSMSKKGMKSTKGGAIDSFIYFKQPPSKPPVGED